MNVDQMCKLSHEERDAAAREIEAATTRLRLVAGRLHMANFLEESHKDFGCSSNIHYATAILRQDPAEARKMRRIANLIDELPLITEAVENGRLSWATLKIIAPVVSYDTEEHWLALAGRFSAKELTALARQEKLGEDGQPSPNESGTTELRILLDEDTTSLYAQTTRSLCEEFGRRLDGQEILTALCFEHLTGSPDPDSTTRQRHRREFARDAQAQQASAEQLVAWANAGRDDAPVTSASPNSPAFGCVRDVIEEARDGIRTQNAEFPQAIKMQLATQARSELTVSASADTNSRTAALLNQFASVSANLPIGGTINRSEPSTNEPSSDEPPTNQHPKRAHFTRKTLTSELTAAEHRTRENPPDPLPNQWAAVSVLESPCPGTSGTTLIRPGPSWQNQQLKYNPDNRLLTPAQRREILRRDGYSCATPDCPNQLWLHTHHITLYSEGGLTLPENMITVCSACHRNIHDGRLHIERKTPRLRWTDNQGRSLRVFRPQPPPPWLEHCITVDQPAQTLQSD